jgi:hypothetical protein
MPASAEQTISSETDTKAIAAAPLPPPKYEPLQNEPLRPSYLQTVLAPSSHGSRAASAAAPSIQSLYASAAAGLSSFEAAQRKEMQDRAKLRLEAELRAEKAKAAAPRDFTLPARPKQPSLMDALFAASFAIDCNNCGNAIANEHYHCSICDSGDFDLCQACVDSGITCDGEDHWLIKRFQLGGSIIPSITETIAPKVKKVEEPSAEIVKEEKPEVLKASKYQGDRTCNSCINGELFPELHINHRANCFKNSLVRTSCPATTAQISIFASTALQRISMDITLPTPSAPSRRRSLRAPFTCKPNSMLVEVLFTRRCAMAVTRLVGFYSYSKVPCLQSPRQSSAFDTSA